MSLSAIGVEIGPTRLRALRLGRRGRAEAMEVAWGARPPTDSIAALRERFGSGNVVAVALDASMLFVKRLELPPLSLEERRRIVATDPQRYFPVLHDTLVAGVREDDLVVAARTELLDGWTEALGVLGSVERVEPAPLALRRHLAVHGVEDALLVMGDEGSTEIALARVERGEIRSLRKIAADVQELARLVASADQGPGACVLCPWREDLAAVLQAHLQPGAVVPVPPPPGAPEAFAVAHGAVLGLDDGDRLTLRSPALERRMAVTTRRRTFLHVAVLVVALGGLAGALDHRRTATPRSRTRPRRFST